MTKQPTRNAAKVKAQEININVETRIYILRNPIKAQTGSRKKPKKNL